MSIDQMYAIWVSWWPFFAMLGIFAVVMALYSRHDGVHSRASSGRSMIDICELNVQELRRQAAGLERIAATLERRDPA